MTVKIAKKRLKELLDSRKWKHRHLAAHLGLSVSMISQYGTAKSGISCKVLMKIADTFDVSTDWLLGRTDDKTLHRTSEH